MSDPKNERGKREGRGKNDKDRIIKDMEFYLLADWRIS